MQKVSAAKLVESIHERTQGISQNFSDTDIKDLTIFCAVHLGYITVGLLFLYSFFFYNTFVFFLAILSGLLGRFILHPLIHFFYRTERPDGIHWIEKPKTPSFPSGHATFLFAIGFLYLYFRFPLGIILLALALLVGVARVFAGVHRWEDIFGSAVVAILAASIIYNF